MKKLFRDLLPGPLRNVINHLKSPYRGMATTDVFSKIYEEGRWQQDSLSSSSGPGSSLSSTEELRRGLQEFLNHHRIKSVVDLGCGDFSWMRELDLTGITYLGFDVVPDLIKENQRNYGNSITKFEIAGAADAPIGSCDLVICRDCLVHLSFEEIRAVLENLRRSDAHFVALTHFPAISRNTNIQTGHWRPLNMAIHPFQWDPPDSTIGDNLGQSETERVLGIWKKQPVVIS